MTPTPLDIAIQEYAYWRSSEIPPDHPARDFLSAVETGAIGAAANICSRLAGHEFEGIDYKSLSPEEITRALTEIRLAPRMASFVLNLSGSGASPMGLDSKFFIEAEEICRELRKTDSL